ncbi:16 kDa phloem protein 1 [Populus trichocarpa]|uniref:16 kDa phloem protein 1 n=1 Tax=Populus trichocarpa TaxID=3694 RepID=UPI000D1881F9|nr:16 kDa phloem protein 1 [Populus trichocarpa]|eukprot:XP_024462734.1 elicitor-responsive protein 1 [Populus trichocarpa]
MAVGILEVQLVNAKGLRDTDFFEAVTGDESSHLTKWRKILYEPVLNGNDKGFEICTAGLEFESGRALLVKDWDSRGFIRSPGPTKYAFQGMRIYVKDLLTSGVQNGTAELHPCKYRVVDASQSYVGEIQVGVTFTLKEEQIYDGEEYGGWNESSF